MTDTKRRSFLKTTTGAIAGSAIISAPAIASGKTKKLKMVTSWPKNFPGLGTAAESFAKRIKEASNGRFQIKVYAGGELVHPLKCHDAVQEGTADLYHSADYYYKGKKMAYAFFAAVPFGFTANEMNAWLMYGGGQQLWDEVGAEFGVKHLPVGNTGVQMGGWFKKEINSLDDLKGLKMRTPGLGGDLLNAVGGTALTLAGSEIMPALQAGTLDAAEWVGPWNDLAFGFYKVVKNYYGPGFSEPGVTLGMGLNKKFWDGLSKEDQAMFTAVAHEENSRALAEFNAKNGAALKTLIDDHGVILREFPDEVYKTMAEASKDVLAKAGATDPLTQKVYDSFVAFRQQASHWSALSDQGYMNKRSLISWS